MRRTPVLLTALLLAALPLPGQSQTTKPDPFEGHHLLRDRKQIVVLKTYPNLVQQTYDFKDLPGVGDTLLGGPTHQYPDSLQELYQNNRDGGVDMATGNFVGDGLDEVVSAWHAQDTSIAVVVSTVEPYTHYWNPRVLWRINKDSLYTDNELNYTHCNRLRLLTGQFDQDENQEFVLAYITADTTLKLILYDAVGDFQFVPVAQVSEQKLFVQTIVGEDPYGTTVERFDIAVADIDEDGEDEVVVAGVEPDGPDGWRGFLKAYDINVQAKTFTPRVERELFHSPTPTGGSLPHGIKVVAGAFDTTRGIECFVAWRNSYYPMVQLARISSDMLSISLGDTMTVLKPGNSSWLALSSGDLNGDDVSEIVVSGMDTLRIFRAGPGLTLKQLIAKKAVTLPDEPSSQIYADILGVRALVVADVNSDTSSGWTPEIVTFQYAYKYTNFTRYRIQAYETVLDSAGNITGLVTTAMKSITSDDMGIMAAGRFDRGDVRLGPPHVFTKSAIVQPLVILNAPPIHFDVFGGSSYDVSKMYGGGPLNFVATYEKASSQTLEMETKISRSWSQSYSLSGGASGPFGLGVSSSLSARYGKGFSREAGSSNTIRIAVKVDAADDDLIYATVAHYDIWEYPAYAGDNLIGHILVLDPNSASVQHGWFPSKSPTATSYVPNHEVGNVLSYRKYSDLRENPELGELVKGSNNVFFSLNASSPFAWSLNFSDFQSQGATTTKTANMEVGASVSGFGITVGVSEDYSDESVYTHKTSVMSDLSLQVKLGTIDMGVGEVGYAVTPYTYWGKNGALVLDYAVQPELAPEGGTHTWWQERYNKQDPAFILPWRYDREKGYTLQDSAKRFQTKEITFQPPDAGRGENVLIEARVRNFGLVNTAVPVAVRFYVGHPDSGGTPIVGTNGVSKVLTDALLPARSWKNVQLPWRIPWDIPQYPRIYAVINPDTVIDEVHTNNNIGFAVLGLSTPPTGVARANGTPNAFALAQNYPNPFNPLTVILYEVPEKSYVRLIVYDVLGRVVATLVDEVKPAGRHQVAFDAGRLATGIYLYRLAAHSAEGGQGGAFTSVKKMLVLK